MTVTAPDIESPLRGLYAAPPEPLPFAPSLHVRAFLLRREAGNVLIYGAPTVDPGTFAGVGGIAAPTSTTGTRPRARLQRPARLPRQPGRDPRARLRRSSVAATAAGRITP